MRGPGSDQRLASVAVLQTQATVASPAVAGACAPGGAGAGAAIPPPPVAGPPYGRPADPPRALRFGLAGRGGSGGGGGRGRRGGCGSHCRRGGGSGGRLSGGRGGGSAGPFNQQAADGGQEEQDAGVTHVDGWLAQWQLIPNPWTQSPFYTETAADFHLTKTHSDRKTKSTSPAVFFLIKL